MEAAVDVDDDGKHWKHIGKDEEREALVVLFEQTLLFSGPEQRLAVIRYRRAQNPRCALVSRRTQPRAAAGPHLAFNQATN